MIDNISPQGTARGAIVASTSKQAPDYWYSWVRDSALTMDVLTLVQSFIKEHPEFENDERLQKLAAIQTGNEHRAFFEDYAAFSVKNQYTDTPSKQLDSNLGEPKFNVDGSSYNGPWGRPQNDGPALRSMAFIAYLEESESTANTDWYSSNKESMIKMDCEYVSKKWNSPSFDLWEEVLGKHFYNAVVYVKALQRCAEMAMEKQDEGAARYYLKIKQEAEGNVKKHFRNGFVEQTLEKERGFPKPSNLDIATILALLHTNMTPNDVIYMSHPKVQATLVKLEDRFRNIYPINSKNDLGTAYGRYPEDTYDGIGNSQGNFLLM